MTGLRIGIVTHNYPRVASESKDAGKFVYNLAQELSKANRVFVLCPDFRGDKEEYKKVPVTWFDWGGGGEKFGNWKFYSPTSPFKFIRLWRAGNKEVLNFVRKNKIDVLVCFWNFPAGLWGLYANYRCKIPYATWALGSDIFIYPKLPVVRQITQLVLQRAGERFGNSFEINKAINKLSGRKAKFLPTSNPVDIKVFKKPKLSFDKYNFFYLGRLEKVKGPDILLEAASVLHKTNKNFSLTMVGGGTMFDDLRSRIKRLGLTNVVNLLGYVEDQKVVNGYLKYSDALVIPSRSESFPLVITEALQAGLPIIGANVGDIPYFLVKHKIGYVFNREDVQDLANVMSKMINNKALKIKRKAYMKNLYEDFKLTKIAKRLTSRLKHLINEN